MKAFKNIIALGFISLSLALSSCAGFLDTNPTDRIPKDMAKSVEDAEKIVNGFYTYMKWNDYYGTPMVLMGETRADDLRPRTATVGVAAIYQYDFSPTNNTYSGLWNRCYNIILATNNLLLRWDDIPTVNSSEVKRKNDAKGQALAVRALCHFDIARMYGYPYQMDNGASLGAVKGDRVIKIGERLPRVTVKETYDFIIDDLTNSLTLLSDKRNWGRFNYWSAKALLARVYLYKGDYDNAFKHADEIITNPNCPYSLVANSDYVSTWSKQDDSETMLELKVTLESNLDSNGGVNSWYYSMWHREGSAFAGAGLVPTSKWISLIEEDPDDVRNKLVEVREIKDKNGVVTSSYKWLAKFPGHSNDPKVNNPRLIRMAEVYLIAAEAALMKSTPDQAKADAYLDKIRKRANPASVVVTATVDEVLKERRKEFIGEGHRFFDLSRLGRIIDRSGSDNVLPASSTYKVVDPWNVTNFYKVVLPLGSQERTANPAAQQNPGYAD